MGGQLAISCKIDQTCSFKTTILVGLFGNAGLGLSSCRSGECVAPATINELAALLAPTAPAESVGLSSGVTAGLVVVSVLLLAVAVAILLGYLSQRQARKRMVVLSEKGLENSPVGVRWRNLGYSLRPAKRGSKSGRVLLQGLSGQVLGGKLLAILGTTGAGKSTFVDLLAGKRKVGRTTGSIELISSNHTSKPVIGYVDQEVVLSTTSTVREALLFAADLKLSENVSIEVKR